MRACRPKDVKRREWRSTPAFGVDREAERESAHAGSGERERKLFDPSFYMFFLPPGLLYVNWVSLECC